MGITNEVKRYPTEKFQSNYKPGGASTEYFAVAKSKEFNSGIPFVGIHKTIYHDLKNFPSTMPVSFERPHEYYFPLAVVVDKDIQAAPLFDRIRNPASAVSGPIVTQTDIGFPSGINVGEGYVEKYTGEKPVLGKQPVKPENAAGQKQKTTEPTKTK